MGLGGWEGAGGVEGAARERDGGEGEFHVGCVVGGVFGIRVGVVVVVVGEIDKEGSIGLNCFEFELEQIF